MTEPIKLPPLPDYFEDFMDRTKELIFEYGQQCARTAIEADRQARGEPVSWLVYLPSEEAQRVYDSQDDPGYVDDITNVPDAVITPLYTTPQTQQIPEGYRLQPLSEFDAMMNTRTIPEGYKLVPIEPTEERARKGYEYAGTTTREVRKTYAAMIEAAPKPKGDHHG